MRFAEKIGKPPELKCCVAADVCPMPVSHVLCGCSNLFLMGDEKMSRCAADGDTTQMQDVCCGRKSPLCLKHPTTSSEDIHICPTLVLS